jgi:hypothetical protein
MQNTGASEAGFSGHGGTCVVGAGPAGLAMSRALIRHGLDFDCFERHEEVGGIWDQANPGSPMYDSAHFISSSRLSGFHGYPMPPAFPDYPHHSRVLAYLRDFARAYGLDERVTTSVAVEQAQPRLDGGWQVLLGNGELRHYDNLICANGTTWSPNRPQLAGEFAGTLIHSREYRSADLFRDKRALIVGGGNSGVDIACDAASNAAAAWISMRRGYHVIPKHLFGVPADVFGERRPHPPVKVAQAVLPLLIRMQIGAQERYGLPKPDHRVFESHPILNSQVFHHLSHGDLRVKPDVERLEGSEVRFVDGSREVLDVVVLATGYRFDVPYLDPGLFEWTGGRPDLYLRLFSPTRGDLFAIGLTEGDGGAYALFDEMADAICCAIRSRNEEERGSSAFEAIRRKSPDMSGGIRHVDSNRHAHYLHLPAYRKQVRKLRRRLGWGRFDPSGLALDSWIARQGA